MAYWNKALTDLLTQDEKHSSFCVSSQVFHGCLKKLGLSFGHPVVDDIMLKCIIQANGDVNFQGLLSSTENFTQSKDSLSVNKSLGIDVLDKAKQMVPVRTRNQHLQSSRIQHLLDHSSHKSEKSTENGRKQMFNTIQHLIRELDVGTLSCNDFRVSGNRYFCHSILFCTVNAFQST